MKMDDNKSKTTQLRSTLDKMKASLDLVNDAIIWTNSQGQIDWCNANFTQLLQCSSKMLLGKFIGEFIQFSKDKRLLSVEEFLQENIAQEGLKLERYQARILDSSTLLEVYARPFGAKHEATSIIMMLRDVTQSQRIQQELEFLHTHDQLTGLYNRASFEAALQTATRKVSSDALFAVLLLDLDNFNSINARFGHHAGDRLLQTVAQYLQENANETHMVARIGGDEFGILLPAIKDIDAVHDFTRVMIKRFNKPFKLDQHCFLATVSVGIAIAPLTGEDATTLLKNAGMALFSVKELGRNNYQFFTELIDVHSKRRGLLEKSLSSAVANGELYLVYQPQYSLPHKHIIGLEALVRWQHPELGLIMPEEFIPVAEKKGFIVPLGQWVLQQAFIQYVQWREAGIIAQDLKLAINLSPTQLNDKLFIESFLTILKETGMPSSNIELELTETELMTSAIDIDPVLEQLQQFGVKISIDDFGTGYSSFTRLKDLPISSLKIDKSFIENLSQDEDSAAIVKSIIALGDSLGLRVITEGVETEEQLQLLSKYQCKLVQGFYFGHHPLPFAQMSQLLQKLHNH